MNYKPNASDKARFEFSPLGKTFSAGLDKTAQGYQEEGVIKLLKDIRDGLASGINRRLMLIDMMLMDLMTMNLMTMNLMIMDLIQRHMILHIHQMMKMILKIVKKI